MSYLRGPTVSYNIQDANFNLYTSIGGVDLTVPADWDNTDSGDQWEFTFTGGVIVPGDEPLGLFAFVQINFDTVDGGSLISAGISPDGLALLPGATVRQWGTYATAETWEIAGLDQVGTIGFDPTTASTNNDVLIDGAPQGFPGDGMVDNGGIYPIQGPIGWAPAIAVAGVSPPAGAKLVAGQTVTVGLSLWFSVDDNTFPDRLAYGVLQTITATYKGTSVVVPITDVVVGFGDGGSVSPYPAIANPDTPYLFNAARPVSFSAPPESTFSQDLYLEGALPATQRTQGHIF